VVPVRVLTEKAQPKDDPLCLQLRQEYLGKILLDFDEEPHLTYKVIDITFLRQAEAPLLGSDLRSSREAR